MARGTSPLRGEVKTAVRFNPNSSCSNPWRLKMPFVTFTVRRGLGAADKSRLSEAMLEAQMAAGYHRADRFHRFLEVGQDDLLVDRRFPDTAADRTDRFMVVQVVISSDRSTAT